MVNVVSRMRDAGVKLGLDNVDGFLLNCTILIQPSSAELSVVIAANTLTQY